MKPSLIVILFTLLCSSAFCQTGNNTISLLFGQAHTITATTGTYPTAEFVNSPFRITSGPHFGLSYDRRIYKGLSVEGSVIYVDEKAQYIYSYATDTHYVGDGHVGMLWVQALCKYTFFKYIFVDAGISVDAQTNYKQTMQMYDQSGFGLEAGFGGKIAAGHFVFSVNPYWRAHSIIVIDVFNIKSTFYKKNIWNHELDEEGIKFGIGYNF
jgi:hypothetical protein